MTLAAIMAALHVSKQKLSDVRMVIFGAGTAGVGIADQVRDAISEEKGVSKEDAAKQIWLVSVPSEHATLFFIREPPANILSRLIDRPGLLTTNSEVSKAQKLYAKEEGEWNGKERSLLEVVKQVKPNVLIGTSTVPGAFTEEIVKAMASHAERPIILPLSNPTRLHEAVPADILKWTEGRALVATGSPFDPVKGPWGPDGSEVEIEVAECNNSVVFPGIGLGAVLARSRLVTDRMLVAAVRGLSDLSPALADDTAPLLPGVEQVRDVSVRVAREVIRAAAEEGVATEDAIPSGDSADGELDGWIREQMWDPVYRPLRRVEPEGASRAAKAELKVVGSLEKVKDKEARKEEVP